MSPKDHRCQFTGPSGRRCKLPRAKGHDSLCFNHWRRDRKLNGEPDPDAEATVARALGFRTELRTRVAVNDLLAKLFSLRARKLVSARDATILAYIAQLILQTLPGVQHEYSQVHDFGAWDHILRKALEDVGISATPEPEPQPARRSRRRASRAQDEGLPASSRQFAQQVFSRLANRLAEPAQEPSPETESLEAEEEVPEYATPD
jgi:hypothetical protein